MSTISDRNDSCSVPKCGHSKDSHYKLTQQRTDGTQLPSKYCACTCCWCDCPSYQAPVKEATP